MAFRILELLAISSIQETSVYDRLSRCISYTHTKLLKVQHDVPGHLITLMSIEAYGYSVLSHSYEIEIISIHLDGDVHECTCPWHLKAMASFGSISNKPQVSYYWNKFHKT